MVQKKPKERRSERMLEVGLRVVRGPDWKWDNQDDGEGHVGTVVEIGKPGSSTSPDKTVVVQWDSGSRTNYRVGYQNAYDLRVYDNAPAGVKHPNIICDGCKKHGIAGMRWKCMRCYDFDLCTVCYMADKHDGNHVFQRFETASSVGVDMPQRKGCEKIPLKGMFVRAKVTRGPDWDWGSQDGGEGKIGTVVDIRGWDNESGRSVANVTWSSGSTNVYRLGHKGKVDLKYVQESPGGTYYKDHLPILGKSIEQQASATKMPGSPRHHLFNVGDKVKVLMDVDTLKHMQEGHGGWNPRMAEYVGKVGTIHRVTDRGDIRVQYEGSNRWTFHPAALTKFNTFAVGDIVQVVEEAARVKEYQKGHGEWIDAMKSALGKVGKVVKIYSDGDLRVSIDGQTWTFNPLCVRLVPGSATELNNTMHTHERSDQSHPAKAVLPNLMEQQLDVTSLDKLVREAAQGHTDVVRELVNKFPDKIDQKHGGKTCLQVACHQGHVEIVKLLVVAKASLEIPDDDGDTALHYAAFGNQPEIMDILLNNGANIDALNKGRCSALHVAVNKQHVNCVQTLLRFKCNVNIQDSYGDTALHDAIGKDGTDVVDVLVGVPGVDFTLRNKRGFNVLHHAALKGNNFAVEKLLSKARQIADVKKDDGFAALHLASLNGHRWVAETLLLQGQCEIDIRNNRKQTPLLLAVSQGHASLVELLVNLGADVNSEDEDGDTGLHLAVMKHSSISTEIIEAESPAIFTIYQHISTLYDNPVALAIGCYLVQKGLDIQKKNHKGKVPLELFYDPDLQFAELLRTYSSQRGVPTASFETETPPALPVEPTLPPLPPPPPPPLPERRPECCICLEPSSNVTFEPCGHSIACDDCCSRMKKCLECQSVILKKIAADGRILATKNRQPSVERLKYLETKIVEIEEAYCCSICMERRRNIAFLCGHGACEKCSQTLKTCHMCRKPITKKINLY